MSKSKFDIDKLTKTIDNVEKNLKCIDDNEKIKKYGTFFDSKQEIIQLYLLFMFFGVNQHTIQQFPKPYEYDVD